VLASVAVASDGTYSFDSISNGTYTVQVTVNAGTVGQPMPATALPAKWANTGEHLGAESGSDGTPDGLLAVTVDAVNLDNANFGIDALPDSTAASGSYMNPGGAETVTVPTLTGSDVEDGALGSGSTVVIETLPGNATLAYNRSPVTPGPDDHGLQSGAADGGPELRGERDGDLHICLQGRGGPGGPKSGNGDFDVQRSKPERHGV